MKFAAIFTGVAIRNAGDEECNMLHVERRCLREHRENNLLSRTNGLPPLLDGTGYWTAWPFTTMAIFSGDDEPLAAGAAEEDSPEVQLPLPDRLLENLGEEQQRAAIDAALRRLPEHQRVPLVLYHFEDLSYQEIAERLRVSLAKVKTDIRRARAAMLPLLRSAGHAGGEWQD